MPINKRSGDRTCREMKLPRVPQRTTPGFAFSMLGRALLDCLGTRQFGQREIVQVLAFFGSDPPECAYCGSHAVRRWDHLVPIKEGGETVLGNMVPACARCDDSKRHLPFEEWMKSNRESSLEDRGGKDIEQRIVRIKAYVQHFGYTPRSLEDRLDKHDWDRLIGIRSRLQELRKDIDELIKDYRTKTGNPGH